MKNMSDLIGIEGLPLRPWRRVIDWEELTSASPLRLSGLQRECLALEFAVGNPRLFTSVVVAYAHRTLCAPVTWDSGVISSR